jgi:hypothetical protein
MRRAGVVAGILAAPFFLVSVGMNTWASLGYLHQLGWEFVGGKQVPWPSSLARGPYRWAQVATFVIAGLLIVVLAVAVRDQLPRRRVSGFAVVLLALLGVAPIFAAFRVDVPMLSGGSPGTWHGWIHGIAFLLIIAMGVLTPVAMALAVRGDPRWRPIPGRIPRGECALCCFPVLAVGQRLIPDGDRHCLRLDHSGCRTPGDVHLLNHAALVANEGGALTAAAL